MNKKIRQFCLPEITGKYIVRLLFVAGLAYVIFGFILLPFRIRGHSMEPTYKNGSFNFCLRPVYTFKEPGQHDVVCIKLAGESVVLLKRIIALPGDTVEFKNGELFVNEKKIVEEYITKTSNWNLSKRLVKKGNVYVVGDNRAVPIDAHKFGQTPVKRIIGNPLW